MKRKKFIKIEIHLIKIITMLLKIIVLKNIITPIFIYQKVFRKIIKKIQKILILLLKMKKKKK